MSKLARILITALASCAVLAACGPSSPSTSGDAGTCSGATTGGAMVYESAGDGTAPTPAGGIIADGTYHLVEHRIHPPGSVDPYWRQRTLVVSGGRFEGAERDHEGLDVAYRGTLSTAGTTLTRVFECPVTTTVSSQYTAMDDQLWLFSESSPHEIYVYARE